MGRKGSRYSTEEKLGYIHLVGQGLTAFQIERQYGVKRLVAHVNKETDFRVSHGKDSTVDEEASYRSFNSGQYNTALAGAGVTPSMSRPETPGDNSPMASLWSHMKTEYFDFERPLSLKEITDLVADFMDWYNNSRRQTTLNGMTPVEYRNHAVKKIA